MIFVQLTRFCTFYPIIGGQIGVFRSTLSRPNKAGLDVCPSFHPSVHKKFLRFDVKVEVDE